MKKLYDLLWDMEEKISEAFLRNARRTRAQQEREADTKLDPSKSIPPEMYDALGLTDGTWEIVQTGERQGIPTWSYQLTDLGIAKLKAQRGELQ